MDKKILQKQVDYWKEASLRDWKTALILFENRRYDSCLFFCHLSLEKILKSLVVEKTKKMSPLTHDLAKLSKLAELSLAEDQLQSLREINSFNISSRYDSVKFQFYKMCTRDYAQNYLNISKKLHSWLKKQFPKKLKRK